MLKNLRFKTLLMLFSLWAFGVGAQDYSFEDFVGTWHGTFSATNYGGFNDPMTMTIYEDGFYTETTGRLMPSTYPNTQQCEYQASTNRFHWWYLAVIYSGQYFYDHHYYSIVHFQNDTLIMHYNFHNNPEPWPDAGVIFLVKENTNTTPPPANLDIIADADIYLLWESPENGSEDPTGYNVYVSVEMNDFELLGFTEETQFMVNETAAAGLNEYYVTAVYDAGESDPSASLYVVFETPEPLNLLGEPQTGEIALEWSTPDFEEVLPAALYGYNVYHKYEDGTFEVVQFTEDLNFVHENPASGMHYYYVTAVYNGGESDPSNQIEVSYVISSLDQNLVPSARIFPNPASDFVTVQAEENIREISIINQQGQLVQKERNGLQLSRIDLSNLPTGVYTLMLETENGVIIRKLIKN